ncbi:uncharacterized protein BXZ73DRAFT_74567 [Epithele typhae]|uniref:uncharacterized protein n=1 Tax=Epithele typhae TaxID=378194 RepID=UPI002007DAB9|nr:uncharacterized protein BXZ73DRAFT_74567 [Epithele typhae]KAH9942282.1 hypothetical protein BXZ73DRAFT_74567 [Epithele typhae]
MKYTFYFLPCYCIFLLTAYLLIAASISAETPSFLNVGSLRFGVFGYTGSSKRIGWSFPTELADGALNGHFFRRLTPALVLIPLSAALAGAAALSGTIGMVFLPMWEILHQRSPLGSFAATGIILMAAFSLLAFPIALVAWILEMILFGVARQRLRSHGVDAAWGNANWMVLGALFTLLVGLATFAFAVALSMVCDGCCGSDRDLEPGVTIIDNAVNGPPDVFTVRLEDNGQIVTTRRNGPVDGGDDPKAQDDGSSKGDRKSTDSSDSTVVDCGYTKG